jgi:mandelate racemase
MPAIHDLVAALKDKPVSPVENFHTNRKSLGLVGLQGVSMIAVSGIDMACWDALAKAAHLPLARMLGGSLGSVPAYNSNGLWLTPIDTLEEEAEELITEGNFTSLKLRLGRATLAEDLAAIDAVRRAGGDSVNLMCDFNQGQTLANALQRCHALDDQGLYWFEEPIAYDALDGYSQLTRELQTPVQLGENFYGPRTLQQALTVKAGDYVMPDLMRIGGVTGWLHSAAIAGAYGTPMSTHLYPEVSAHLMRVTETAHWLEWQDWANAILAEPFPIKDGLIMVPDRPGTGINWNEEAVTHYLMEA